MKNILKFTLVCMATQFSVSVMAKSPPSTRVTEKALAYVQTAGQLWKKSRGCVSCHQVPSMIWCHEAAARNGVHISRDELAKWKIWSTNVVNFVKPEQKDACDPEATMASNIDTMVAMLLAIPSEPDLAWRRAFVKKLIAEQGEDGSWRACGQLPLQRRPELETQAVTTLWVALALIGEGVAFNRDAAISFAGEVTDVKSTEWLAVRLLVADAIDEDAEARFQNELMDSQNEDGGWGWRIGDASDALGTGYALYALAKTGVSESSQRKVRDFLARTQTDSGKWIVPGTKKSAKGKPTATANDWGTAWAVIALAESE